MSSSCDHLILTHFHVMSAGRHFYAPIIPVEIGDVIKLNAGCNQVATARCSIPSPRGRGAGCGMNGGLEPNPHPSLLPVSEGAGASLARQRLVNRFGIKAAEAFITDDNDRQRA